MPDIARLDANGVLIAVETVPAGQHRTDLANGIIALSPGHDMRRRLNGYCWDQRRGCFMPLATDPLIAATVSEEDDSPASPLLDAIIDALAHLEEATKTKLPTAARAQLASYQTMRSTRRKAR
jgi:hypothetical protein